MEIMWKSRPEKAVGFCGGHTALKDGREDARVFVRKAISVALTTSNEEFPSCPRTAGPRPSPVPTAFSRRALLLCIPAPRTSSKCPKPCHTLSRLPNRTSTTRPERERKTTCLIRDSTRG